MARRLCLRLKVPSSRKPSLTPDTLTLVRFLLSAPCSTLCFYLLLTILTITFPLDSKLYEVGVLVCLVLCCIGGWHIVGAQ